MLDKPDEFIELKKSIYYNVALIYKDKGHNIASLYFFMQMHKISPDNVSLLAEMGMLCRKELRLPQALYYFELALSLESSQTNKLLYAEQIMILRYCLDQEATGILKYLRSCGYKQKELTELSSVILSGEHPRSSNDFLCDDFEWAVEHPQRRSVSAYVQKIFDLKAEWRKHKLRLIEDEQKDQESLDVEEPDIPVRIGKLKWKELLSVLLVLLKINSLEKKGSSDAEIRRQVETVGAYRWLGTIDVDIWESTFRIELEEPEPPLDKKQSPVEVVVGPRREDVQRTPLIAGQMALREKKPALSKPGGEVHSGYSADGSSATGFEGLMARLHNSGALDPQERNYYVYAVSQLYQLTQQGATVVEKDLEASIKECNKRLIEDSMSQDNLASSGEKTKLSNLTLNDIDVVEEADLISFHAEKLKNKSLTFRELCSLVIEHLLGVKARNIHGGQLNGAEISCHGPSPLLYFAE